MNILDVVLAVLLLLGLVRGLFKGFFVELAGLVALVAGVYVAAHYSAGTYIFVQDFINWEEQYLRILSLVLTFLFVVLLIYTAARLLTKLADVLALGIVNRIFGGLVGLLKMAFLSSLFFMLISYFGLEFPDEETTTGSLLYRPVKVLAPAFVPELLEKAKQTDLLEAEF